MIGDRKPPRSRVNAALEKQLDLRYRRARGARKLKAAKIRPPVLGGVGLGNGAKAVEI